MYIYLINIYILLDNEWLLDALLWNVSILAKEDNVKVIMVSRAQKTAAFFKQNPHIEMVETFIVAL